MVLRAAKNQNRSLHHHPSTLHHALPSRSELSRYSLVPHLLRLVASPTNQVTDFGLSRPEMIKPRMSNVRGTFGYLDPEYTSTRTFTKKSDVYSFGVLLFELITGRNPQQGLMEYVKLAAMESEGKIGWEEIVDLQLNGNYDVHKLNDMASLAFKCVDGVSKNRPSMREIVLALSQLYKKHSKNSSRASPAALKEVSVEVDQLETHDFSSIECSKVLRRLPSR